MFYFRYTEINNNQYVIIYFNSSYNILVILVWLILVAIAFTYTYNKEGLDKQKNKGER